MLGIFGGCYLTLRYQFDLNNVLEIVGGLNKRAAKASSDNLSIILFYKNKISIFGPLVFSTG